MAALKPNETRANNAILLVWVTFFVVILAGVSSWMQFNLIEKVEKGEFVDLEALAQNDLRENIVAVLLLVAKVISGIYFILWFRRAYYNLSQLTKLVSYSDGWAAGAWFVPILKLFRPYQIMNQLYVITPALFKKNGVKSHTEISKGNIALWWTLWIMSTLSSNISGSIILFDQSLKSFKFSFYFDMLTTLLFIPLTLITTRIIREYTNYAKQLKEFDNEKHFDAFIDVEL